MEFVCKECGECLKTRMCVSFADVSEKVVGTVEMERRPGLQSPLCTGEVHGRGDTELELKEGDYTWMGEHTTQGCPRTEARRG